MPSFFTAYFYEWGYVLWEYLCFMRYTVRPLVLWHLKYLGKYSFEFSKRFFAAYRMAVICSKPSLSYARNRTLTFVPYRVETIDREARHYTKLCFVKSCYVHVIQGHATPSVSACWLLYLENISRLANSETRRQAVEYTHHNDPYVKLFVHHRGTG